MSIRFSLTQIGVIGPSGQTCVFQSRSSMTTSPARRIPERRTSRASASRARSGSPETFLTNPSVLASLWSAPPSA